MQMLEHAIKYHRMGVGVIPLWPGSKKPIISRWEPYQRRRPTEQEIRAWWQRWPDANIGIVTGMVSGLVVLDVDSEEGNESLKGRHMPATAAVQTIKGYHYYWQHPGGSGLGNWVRKMPGCDLRADGGYVVAPPSVHPSGERYEWMIEMESREALAEAPLWLIEMCGAKHIAVALPEEDEWYTQALKGAKEGQRNDLAARLAGRYLAMGMSRSETEVFMLAWNKKNKPPLPEAELIRTINSIARRDHTRRVSESLVSGEDVEINAMNESDQRDVILSALQQALDGVKIHRIIKYLADRPTYTLETATGSINLGDVTNLIQQAKFRTCIAELESKYLKPFKPKVWDMIAEKLLELAEDVEVSEEATVSGQTKGWLREYLERFPPLSDVAEAAGAKRPFIKSGSTYIFKQHFSGWIARSSVERITEKDLVLRLKAIGGESVTSRSGKTVVRCWKLPELTDGVDIPADNEVKDEL